MPKFDVLDSNHTFLMPHFLEASAGTGKTFAIEHIVVRLLLEDACKIMEEEILVVTFTRAATRELKMRIRKTLCEAITALNEEKFEKFPYLANLSREKKDKNIKILEGSLLCYDKMQIFTLHGFCLQMLKKFGFDAGICLNSSEMEANASLYDQVVDFLRIGLNSKEFHPVQIDKVMRNFDYSLDKIIEKILSLLSQDAQIPVYMGYEEGVQAFDAIIKEVDATLLMKDFSEVAPNFRGLVSRAEETHLPILRQVKNISGIDSGLSIEERFQALIKERTLVFSLLTEENFKKRAKISFEYLNAKNSWFFLKKTLEPLLVEVCDYKKILLRIVAACKEYIKIKGDDTTSATPDELLKQMQQSLNIPEFLKRVQKQYKAAIIDEFQDTDPIQWDIFDKLFFKDRKDFPLFLVGDPKQSIYAFRNADLSTYIKAAQGFLPSQRFSLDVNYRSEPLLIKTLNRLFSISPSWLSEEGALTYQEVQANPHAQQSEFHDGYGCVHLCVACDGEEKVVPSIATEESFLFPFIAQEILKLHKTGTTFNAFAVLIKDRFQAKRLERYLKTKDIPVLTASAVNLIETKAFTFFKTLIRLIGDVGNKSALKELLAHPMMGFSHEMLRLDRKDPLVLSAMEHFHTLSRVYKEKGFLVFWDMFLQTSFGNSSFEQKLVSAKDFQNYQDLMQLADLIIEEHKRHSFSHEECVHLLNILEKTSFEEDVRLKRKAYHDGEAVTIMTTHKSKGLEFEIVFALGMCSRPSFKEEIMRYRVEDSHEFILPNENKVKYEEALQKINEEKLRQFYVALTRAKKRVYLPFCSSDSSVSDEMLSPIELFFKKSGLSLVVEELFNQLNSLAIENLTFEMIHINKLQMEHHEEKVSSFEKPIAYTKKFPGLYISSYSSQIEQLEASPKPLKVEKEELSLPSSAETGNILHKILEKVFEKGFYQNFCEKTLIQWITKEVFFSSLKGKEKEIFFLIEKVLKIRLKQGDVVWSFQDIPASHLVTEMEFLLEQNASEAIKGFIDLMFCYQGKYYLVDWKSNHLPSYEEKQLQICMQESGYDVQADIYGRAVRCYLEEIGQGAASYGGIFYIFLRGIEKESFKGIYHIL